MRQADTCPIKSPFDALQEASFRFGTFNEPRPHWVSRTPEHSDSIPWKRLSNDKPDEYPNEFTAFGRTWTRRRLAERHWTRGPNDRSRSGAGNLSDSSNPKHFHCDILSDGLVVHLDYIAWFSAGPFSGTGYLIFSQHGTVLAEGGHVHRPFVGAYAINEPCAVLLDDTLIIASRTFLELPESEADGVSLWKPNSTHPSGQQERCAPSDESRRCEVATRSLPPGGAKHRT